MRKISLFIALFFLFQIAKGQNTWNDNVGCIIYTHCASCHYPGGIGQFDLTAYANASSMGNIILNSIQNKRMPPYPPDTFQRYTHERRLSQSEIDQIANWVANGTPLGTGASPIPPAVGGVSITNPDLVVKMPNYTVNTASGGDLYRCFPISINLGNDRSAVEIEVIPGNRKIVHHVLVFQDSTNIPAQLDAADPGPGYTSGGTGSNASVLLTAWVPGQMPQKYPAGFGVRIKGNTTIVIQVHYPNGVVNEVDSTKVLVKYSNGTVRNLKIIPVINHVNTITNGPLSIPANTVKTFYGEVTTPASVSLLAVAPHMHKVGTSFKSFGVTLQNDTIPLINIPRWDFNWQGDYRFRKIIKIPIGTKLYATATYDNTTANPFNPSNPPQLVTAGEATTDEMMLEYFTFTNYQQGDENIIVDTSSQKDYNLYCSKPNSIEDHSYAQLSISPNPTSGLFIINELHESDQVFIYNSMGKCIGTYLSESIDLVDQPSGLYWVIVEQSNGVKWRGKLYKY